MIRNGCIVLVILSISANLSIGGPLPEEAQMPKEKDDKSIFNLPFLQFGNGGVRVNFAGYHAEAGLGGLLGGPGKGGLYAGAGAPQGAHASADLGGALSGEEGAGGLRARAGLGNGGPESAAGLGGNLDGYNSGNNGGRLYAGASNGITTKIVTKDIGAASSHQSNIQLIPKKSDVNQDAVTNSADASPKVGPMRRDTNTQDDRVNAVEPIPITVINEAPQTVYPLKRCRRKRLCSNFARQTLGYQQYIGNQLSPDLGLEKPLPGFDATNVIAKRVAPDISTRIATDATGYKDIPVTSGPASYGPPLPQPARRTFFDDIFNIPIATLTAVNQLLNSKIG